MVEGLGEASLTVEPGSSLVDRVDCDQPSGDGLARDDRHPQRIREQPRAEAGTLLGSVDRKACDQDHSDRVSRHAADEPRGRVRALHRAHRQARVANDTSSPYHDEGSRRVHCLSGERVAAKPSVELVDARPKAGKLVIESEPLETQLFRAQLRGSGSLRSSATSSGTIVPGSSSAA